MTEHEWTTSQDTRKMLRALLKTTPKTRRLRLFAVACCRRVWEQIPTREARELVELLERYLDKQASWREVLDQRKAADRVYGPYYNAWARGEASAAPYAWAAHQAAGQTPEQIVHAAECTKGRSHGQHLGNTGDDLEQAALLRDIFGNPYRPVTFAKSWRTSTAVALASQMYETRDFGAMPILADALQEAGCDHDDILAHCRDPHAAHVRGCWVVDLVLGKA